MFASVLIANRGEIASRIIRTARRMGIRSIAVHSDVDATMPFVRDADEAVMIGAAPPSQSYLVAAAILDAARQTGAAAIHPGYGFLSENAAFAEAVQEAGLIWVGPPPSAIRAMGLKDEAKRLMQQAGVPVTPGYLGDDQAPARMKREAERIGYPVLIKAIAGGGGKGMRRVDRSIGFDDALASCRREAQAAFGDDRVLLEKFVTDPRHVEVQVFGDQFGSMVHLFERDCSLQRRHQKVIEEAPAPGMDEVTRAALCAAAVQAAKAVNYVGAGTVEFIADASQGLRADRIWFMEMNTRLQVEHPVTEMITGQDLVEWQFRVAAGEPLPKGQDELAINGWAIEARLYAENPATGFMPSTGRLEHLRMPSGLRVDSGYAEGCEVTAHYDPLIAKLVAHATNRKEAAAMLAKASASVEIWPVKSNAAFLARAADHPDFLAGHIDTGFIERHGAQLEPGSDPDSEVLQAAAHALLPKGADDPWTALIGFRIAASCNPEIVVQVNGSTHVVVLDPAAPHAGSLVALGDGQHVLFLAGQAWNISAPQASVGNAVPVSDGVLLSPMPGRIVSVAVERGSRVERGQKLVVIEAMKMEHALVAPFPGVVSELNAVGGAQVAEGVMMARIEKDES